MIPYIVHVSIIIAVCFLFYKIFLQRETFFRLNRWVLLAFMIISFSLPFLPVPSKWSLRNTVQNTIHPVIKLSPLKNINKEEPTSIKDNTVTTTPAVTPPAEPISLMSWLYYLYIAGVAIFAINFLFQLIVLIIQCYTRPFVQDGPFRIIEVSGNKAPCSFGNNIFINPAKYDFETYNQILLHEKIHCSQKHSIDIILAEMALIFQWFNPFAWLYRKQVESNLEFLTDDSMIHSKGIEPSGYQLNLLKVAVPHLPLGITTNYNQSLLKKRIAMMNEKKSSLHTAWKYFFLLPLLTGLVCALNQPVASAQSGNSSTVKEKNDNDNDNENDGMQTEGTWFATIKKDKISFEFKGDHDGHNWNNNCSFPKADFPELPTQQKGDFKLVRDAGTILFNGKFDGDIGYGHYKFTADQSMKSYLEQQHLGKISDNDMFAFFMVHVTKAYVEMVQKEGYTDISKDNLIAMAALEVDQRYIHFWKTLGYNKISPDHLISSKALGIDSAYVDELNEAGYKNMDMDKMTAFKAQGITGDYIRKMKKARADKGVSGDLSEEDIITSKAMNIDDAFVKSFNDAGYADISFEDLVSMKSLGISPAFIKSFEAVGYKHLSVSTAISYKSLDITPEFIKSFEAAGFKDIHEDGVMSLKSLGIKPEYIKSFKDIGFKDISLDEVASVKSMGVTPEYIKSFKDIGFKDISLDQVISVKSMGITPEYIKSFKDIGFKDISLDQVTSVKSMSITPGYIKGFKDIGFKDISLDEVTSVKSMGITPEYIVSMRKKGFDSKDINKYIELKSSFKDVQ